MLKSSKFSPPAESGGKSVIRIPPYTKNGKGILIRRGIRLPISAPYGHRVRASAVKVPSTTTGWFMRGRTCEGVFISTLSPWKSIVVLEANSVRVLVVDVSSKYVSIQAISSTHKYRTNATCLCSKNRWRDTDPGRCKDVGIKRVVTHIRTRRD